MWQDCSLTVVQRNTALDIIHDGLNLRCLDQCHGVRSYGTSSSAQMNCCTAVCRIDEFTSLFSRKVISAGLPRKAFSQKHAFVDISVFLWLHKQRPSFVQGQPKSYFQLKELHRATTGCKKYSQMNADRRAEKAQYAEFNVPTSGGADAKMWAF